MEFDYTVFSLGPASSKRSPWTHGGLAAARRFALVRRLDGRLQPCGAVRRFGYVVWLERLTTNFAERNAVGVRREVEENDLDERSWLRLLGSLAAELELELRRFKPGRDRCRRSLRHISTRIRSAELTARSEALW